MVDGQGIPSRLRPRPRGCRGSLRTEFQSLRETFELILSPGSVPPFGSGAWMPLDIPLSSFTIDPGSEGYTWDDWDWANVGQMILSTAPSYSPISAQVVVVDNIYWHK